jgi:hypothetical protein
LIEEISGTGKPLTGQKARKKYKYLSRVRKKRSLQGKSGLWGYQAGRKEIIMPLSRKKETESSGEKVFWIRRGRGSQSEAREVRHSTGEGGTAGRYHQLPKQRREESGTAPMTGTIDKRREMGDGHGRNRPQDLGQHGHVT